MPLQSPKKQDDGYLLALSVPIAAPGLACDLSGWTFTEEWRTWATGLRKPLIGEMLGHGSWFSRPPRRELLEPLLKSWESAGPEVPGVGKAKWVLKGLLMTAKAITPVWTVDFTPDQDTISLFEEDDTREIQICDLEVEDAPPTTLRSRDHEARKFLAKERVREARLKAQIAEHMAAKEEARFFKLYGDLEDGESHFSDYDLTDESESDSDVPSSL
jgi:hypothetical protein